MLTTTANACLPTLGCPVPGWPVSAPYGWPVGPGWDPELDRLRELERQAQREAEKAAIRERLRRMGLPEDQITGRRWPCPVGPALPRPVALPPLTVDEVLRRVPQPAT